MPPVHGYEDDAPAGEGGRYFSGPAAAFNGFGGDPDAHEHDELSAGLPARTSQGRAVATHHDDEHHDEYEYENDDHAYRGADDAAADEYFDEAPAPRRRNGLLVIMAVLALTVVGTAGAFGYRAMFGGSVLPTLPPIIKAGNGPNKIVPAYGESQANNAAQPGAANPGSGENLVSREEQPVNIEPAKGAARRRDHSDHHRAGLTAAGRRRTGRAGTRAAGRYGRPECSGAAGSAAACTCRGCTGRGCCAGPGSRTRGGSGPAGGRAEENPHGHHQVRSGGGAVVRRRSGAAPAASAGSAEA